MVGAELGGLQEISWSVNRNAAAKRMILNSSSICKLNATVLTIHIRHVCTLHADIFHNNFLGTENTESSSTERLKSNDSLPKL